MVPAFITLKCSTFIFLSPNKPALWAGKTTPPSFCSGGLWVLEGWAPRLCYQDLSSGTNVRQKCHRLTEPTFCFHKGGTWGLLQNTWSQRLHLLTETQGQRGSLQTPDNIHHAYTASQRRVRWIWFLIDFQKRIRTPSELTTPIQHQNFS